MPRMLPARHARRRGAALILALGVLALLTFVSLAFATITRTELRASQNARDGERARYVAWAGVERAKYEVRRAVQTPGYPVPWLQANAFNYEQRKFENGTGLFEALEPGDTRIATRHPSFGCYLDPIPSALDSAGTNKEVAKRLPWPSGIVGGTYYRETTTTPTAGTQRFQGDYYSLRVTDCSAQIFINDQSPHIGIVLDNLGAIVGVPNAGSKIVSARTAAKGFIRRLEELRGTFTDDEYAKLEPFITCAAAVDQKVIENGRQGSGSGPAKLTALPRAPINMNLAPREVLLAALHGGPGASGIRFRDRSGTSRTISPSKLANLVTQIEAYRADPNIVVGSDPNPRLLGSVATRRFGFSTWPEFAQFLRATAGATGLDAVEQAAVLANANPNTDLNKLVPDLSIFHEVDKSDLEVASTEFSFAPTGVFTIESTGVILGPDARPVAQAKARSTVRVWERYVETTQADFEADRVDPAGASLAGLRDITSLPEFRNDSIAHFDPSKTLAQQEQQTGLHAANYDGQLTFNVITRTRVALKGMFQGFIDRTLNGKGAQSGNTLAPAGGARVTSGPGGSFGFMTDPTSQSLDRFDGASSNDAAPLGAFVGRPRAGAFGGSGAASGRALTFPQGNDPGSINAAAKHYEIPEATLEMNVSIIARFSTGGLAGSVFFTLTATIDDYGYDCIENQGFELWFKPSIDASLENRSRQVLLDWHSGPVETLSVPATNVLRNGSATADSTTFDGSFYSGVLQNFANDDQHFNDQVNYGAQAYLGIWLDRDPGTNTFSLHGKFRLEKNNPGRSDPQGLPYEKAWHYSNPPLQHGTWHHALLTFSQPPRGMGSGQVSFWADGNEQGSVNGEPAWPTEISGQGQLIEKAVQDFKARVQDVVNAIRNAPVTPPAVAATVSNPTFAIRFNKEDYRVPVVVPIADDSDNVYIGCKDPASCVPEMGSAVRFLGLVDNVVFHNDWVRKIDRGTEFPSESYIRRYDSWRPSLGTDTPDDTNTALIFRKHTPALEWAKPIRILSYEVTAWRNEPSATDDTALVELGRVYLHFGWKSGTTQLPADVTGSGGFSPNDPAGWTGRLTLRPYNALSNAYLLPDRDNRVANSSGFLTRSGEEYHYALEVLPVLDVQTGPRMAPVIDDVTVVYMPWDTCVVLREEEIVD